MKIPSGLIFNNHKNENMEKDFRTITFDKNKIDWHKVWEKYKEGKTSDTVWREDQIELQELIEKSLRGEL